MSDERRRPHVDLARLSTALAREILAASEQEVREISALSGHSLAGAARDVRRLIAAATNEPDRCGAVLAEDAGARAPCVH